jgi:hypothetical protein
MLWRKKEHSIPSTSHQGSLTRGDVVKYAGYSCAVSSCCCVEYLVAYGVTRIRSTIETHRAQVEFVFAMATSTSDKDDLDWDDVGFDPHRNSLEEGRVMGQSAGELAGFRDGQRLGHTKGIEFGMELGFIQGFVNALDDNNTTDLQGGKTTNERVNRSLTELQKALDDFPSCEAMFEHSEEIMTLSVTTTSNNNNDGADSEGAVTKFDVLAKMQRVRARFKLLTVQLGMGTVSLKQVLALGVSGDGGGAQELPTREW